MKLTILNVAYPFSPVSIDSVGGAEQVLATLDEALAAAGHHSIVVAARGSRVRGTLVESCHTDGILTEENRQEQYQVHREKIGEALRRFDVDLIHMHGVDFYEYLPGGEQLLLVTLHLPPDWYPEKVYQLERENTWLHCVSEDQHRRCPRCEKLLPPISNGVRIPTFGRRHAPRNFVLSMGRICPEKGFHLGMEAARLAGVPFGLAGEVFPYETHQRYFEDEIRPRQDRRRRYLGALNAQQKGRVLNRARCLLVPSLVAETSSLVAMEALACGTPVVGFPHGALPGVVEHGVTGYLVGSVEEMAEAIGRCDGIDREACRTRAKERFSSERMTREYLERYAWLAEQGRTRKEAGERELAIA